jgi:hypothetical protein
VTPVVLGTVNPGVIEGQSSGAGVTARAEPLA